MSGNGDAAGCLVIAGGVIVAICVGTILASEVYGWLIFGALLIFIGVCSALRGR